MLNHQHAEISSLKNSFLFQVDSFAHRNVNFWSKKKAWQLEATLLLKLEWTSSTGMPWSWVMHTNPTVDGSEIPNNHLGYIKPYTGISTTSTGAGFQPSTVCLQTTCSSPELTHFVWLVPYALLFCLLYMNKKTQFLTHQKKNHHPRKFNESRPWINDGWTTIFGFLL